MVALFSFPVGNDTALASFLAIAQREVSAEGLDTNLLALYARRVKRRVDRRFEDVLLVKQCDLLLLCRIARSQSNADSYEPIRLEKVRESCDAAL
jgi:hypothetical protein